MFICCLVCLVSPSSSFLRLCLCWYLLRLVLQLLRSLFLFLFFFLNCVFFWCFVGSVLLLWIPLFEVFFSSVCLVRGEFLGFRVYIIIDNGKPFSNRLMDKLSEDFGFKKHNPSMYNAPTNGLVEAFNKTLRNLFKKVVGRSKKDWHERINETLWAYWGDIGCPLMLHHICLCTAWKLFCL